MMISDWAFDMCIYSCMAAMCCSKVVMTGVEQQLGQCSVACHDILMLMWTCH